MRLALAQIDSVVGDLDGNRERIVARVRGGARGRRRPRPPPRARRHRLSARGSAAPPRLRPRRAARRREIAAETHGHRRARRRAPPRRRPLQRLLRLRRRRDRGVYRKRFLPNYGVFDENRYFAPGGDLVLLSTSATRSSAPTICEDIWQPGPAGDRSGARGRAARRQHLGVAVPRRQGPRARGDASRRARGTTRASSRSATRSAARTSSSSTGTRS